MFNAKEEKANFKLENESQLNVRHFLTDIFKVTNRLPYVKIISENNILRRPKNCRYQSLNPETSIIQEIINITNKNYFNLNLSYVPLQHHL